MSKWLVSKIKLIAIVIMAATGMTILVGIMPICTTLYSLAHYLYFLLARFGMMIKSDFQQLPSCLHHCGSELNVDFSECNNFCTASASGKRL